MSPDSIWGKLPKPWQMAVEMTWEAYLDGCIPIGATIADADGNILTKGRNRIYEKRASAWSKRGAELAQAEDENDWMKRICFIGAGCGLHQGLWQPGKIFLKAARWPGCPKTNFLRRRWWTACITE